MSEIETINFTGKCQWASVPPNQPRKPYEVDPKSPDDCFYTIDVECSKEKFDSLMKKGLPRLTTLKEDEEGNTYIRLKATKIKGEYEFDDIPVVDKYGRTVTDKIANGSTVIAQANLVPIKGRKNMSVLRLQGVQVLDLIPFAGKADASKMFTFETPPEEEGNPHEQQEAYDRDNQEQDCDDIPF